jgi:hypothetical protein
MIENSDLSGEQMLKYTTKLVESAFFRRTLVENYDLRAIEVQLDPRHPPGAIKVK